MSVVLPCGLSVGNGVVEVREAEAVQDVVGQGEDTVFGAGQEPCVDQAADVVVLVSAGGWRIGRDVRVVALVGELEQGLRGPDVEDVTLEGPVVRVRWAAPSSVWAIACCLAGFSHPRLFLWLPAVYAAML